MIKPTEPNLVSDAGRGFDSAMRRFESSRPSHAFVEFGDLALSGAEPRIPRAFAGAEIGDLRN